MPRFTTRSVYDVYLCLDRALRLRHRKGSDQRRRPGAQERIQQRCPCVRSPSSFLPPIPYHFVLLNVIFCMTDRRPQPFQSMLKPRSAKAESLVRALDLPDY